MVRWRVVSVAGLLMAAAILAAWSFPTSRAVTGGPDAYGYGFDDAVPYSWIPAAGVVVADNAENCQNPPGSPDFGFGSFSYYGTSYTDLLVCPNGFVKFTGATTSGLNANSQLPYTSIPNSDIVALSASGLNPTLPGSGKIYFDEQAAASVVTWDLVNITAALQVQFQIVLRDTGVIDVQYNSVTPAYANVPSGIESPLGDMGLMYTTYSLPPRIANGTAVRYMPPAPPVADTLTITGEDLAPATVEQTSINVVLGRYILTAGSGAVAVKTVRLEKLGTVADAAIYLGLYNDTNDNGLYESGVDGYITGWQTPAGGMITYSFGAPVVVRPGLPQRWLAMAYCLCPAVPGATLGVRVSSGAPSFDVAGIDTVVYSPGSPIDSSLATVTALPTSTLSVAFTDAAPASVQQGQEDVLLLGMRWTVDTGAVRVTRVNVTLTGVPPSDTDVRGVLLVSDQNGNGAYDYFVDDIVGTTTFTAGVATFWPWVTVTAAAPMDLLVTVSIANSAGIGDTLGASVLAVTDMMTDTCNGLISPAGFPGASSNAVIVGGVPNTVSLVSWNDRAPGTVFQGDTDIIMAEFSLGVDAGVARIDWSGGLNITLTGVPPDTADLSGGFGQANLWEDLDGDGWKSLGADRFIGGGWFAAVGPDFVAQITPFGGTPLELHAGGARDFLITYDISPTATLGHTVGARIDNVTAVQFLTNTVFAATNLPAQTTDSLIAAGSPDTLTHVLTDVAPATVAPFERGIPFGQLQVDVLPGPGGNRVDVTGLNLQRLGTATDADVGTVLVVHDRNGNGAFDGGVDLSLGSGTFTGGQAWITFDMLGDGVAVSGGTPEDLLLLMDIDPAAMAGRTVGLRIAAVADLLINMAGGDTVDPAGFPLDTGLATIAGPGSAPALVSPWAVVAPTLDGAVGAGEWADGLRVDLLKVAGNKLDAHLLVKNDATSLYVAYDAPGDFSRAVNDFASVAFDTGNDGIATDGREDVFAAGGFYESQNHWTWEAATNAWVIEDAPFDTGLANHAGLALVRSFGPSASQTIPHEMAEFRIPLALLGALPGDTLGFIAGAPPWPNGGVVDYTGFGVGLASGWPTAFGTMFASPQLSRYGDLVLSSAAASDLIVSVIDQAPAVVIRGQTDVLMESLTLIATIPSVTLDALTVTRSGTGTDADVAAVRLFDDVNDNGAYDPGTDTLLGGPVPFTAGLATLSGLGKTIAGGTPESLLLLYDVSVGATPGVTLGGALPDPAAFSLAAGATVSGGFPLASSDSRVNSPPGSASLAVNGYLDATPGILHIITPPSDPALSWTISDLDGDPQSAYEVEVWTGPAGSGSSLWDTGPVASGAGSVPYTGAPLVDGASYYFRATVSDGLEWGGWTEVAFRINTPPPVPGLPIDPLDDSLVTAAAGQVLTWGTVMDAETDTITYTWEAEENGPCSFLVLLAGGTVVTNASGPFPTQPGAAYCWHVSADDSWEGSGWGPDWNFTTDNALPTATGLGIDGFADGTPGILHVLSASPLLNWTYGDLEGRPQTAFEARVGSAPGLNDVWSPGPVAGATSSIVYAGAPLLDGTDYWFGISVFDGAAWGPWAQVRFHSNSPPTVPGLPITPPDTAVIPASPSQVVTWTDSADGEMDTVTYTWEVEENGPCSFAVLLATGTAAANVSGPFSTTILSAYCWRVQADDGWELSGWGPAWGFTTNALTNTAPTLSLPAVTPAVGNAATLFSYTVRYSDPDGDAPGGGFPAVAIEKGGVPLAGTPFAMVFGAWVGLPSDWVAGAGFRYDTMLAAGGTDYTFAFTAADALGAFTSTAPIDAPDVTNSAPALGWLGSGNYVSDGLDPEVGTTATLFTFQVVYSDANGDAPSAVDVVIERPLGTPWGTLPLSGGTWLGLSGDYVVGRVFAASVNLPASGADYHYRFAASDGVAAATGAPTAFLDAPDVDDPPMAVASISPATGDLSTAFAFDASGSLDDVGIAAWLWDFGDGTNATTAAATHTYTTRGTFSVSLTVWDARTQMGTDTATVDVLNRDPVAGAGVDFTASVGSTVTLDATSSSDPDGDVLAYAWAQVSGPAITLLGASTAAPSFVPSAAGTYVFVVTVSDGLGGSAVDTVTVTAIVNLAPTAVISVVPMSGTLTTAFAFDGTASNDPDGVILTYAWDFGDGGSSVTATATHTYGARGAFTVTLTVTDDDGSTGQATLAVTVGNRGPVIVSRDPAASAVSLPAGAAQRLEVVASDPDGDPLTYSWSVDGTPAGTDSPFFTFPPGGVGTYAVRVVVSDGTDQVTQEWTVQVTQESPWMLVALLAIVLAVALLLILLWLRRRKKKEPEGSAPPQDPARPVPTALPAEAPPQEEIPDIPPPPPEDDAVEPLPAPDKSLMGNPP